MSGDARAPVVKEKNCSIPAMLDQGTTKFPVEIVKMTQTGVMVRMTPHLVQAGHYYHLEFELPGEGPVNVPVQVRKTYDRLLDPKLHKVDRIVEFNFGRMPEEPRARILDFLRTAGNK